jgi:hypothetical protein
MILRHVFVFVKVGTVKHCEVEYDASGRSEGNATVVFASKSDAVKAVKTFNGRTLDGDKVSVKSFLICILFVFQHDLLSDGNSAGHWQKAQKCRQWRPTGRQ